MTPYGQGFMQPALYCLQQSASLIWVMSTGDGLVCAAYLAFSALLLTRHFKTTAVPRWVVWLFVVFLWLSAGARAIDIVNTFWAFYWVEAGMKNVIGVLAVVAVVLVFRMTLIVKMEDDDAG